MMFHFSNGSHRMFSECEKRLVFKDKAPEETKPDTKKLSPEQQRIAELEKQNAELLKSNKEMEARVKKLEEHADAVTAGPFGIRTYPDGSAAPSPELQRRINTDRRAGGYVEEGFRGRRYEHDYPQHAASRARECAHRHGYRPSRIPRGPSSGGSIDEVQNPEAQARMWEIRQRSQIIGRNRVTGREYNSNTLDQVRDMASWRRHGSAMSHYTMGIRNQARDMGIDHGRAPVTWNDVQFAGHQDRLVRNAGMRMGYQSNTYAYYENPYLKRGGFDAKGRPIDRQGAFRGYLERQGYDIPKRPRGGGGGGSINEYWDAVNHDKLNGSDFDDLKGDPKYEELMRMYRRRQEFGMDDNPKYYVHELETLRRLRKGAQRMDAEIPQDKVLYTHSIVNNGELGYGYATVTLEHKIDPVTKRPKMITLRDIRSNRVGEVDLSFGKSTGLIFENGIRITTNRHDKGASDSDYNRLGNIAGFNFGFTQPGTYTIRYRSSAGQGQECIDQVTVEPNGKSYVTKRFEDAPAGTAQKNPKNPKPNTNSSPLNNKRFELYTSEPPEPATTIKPTEKQKSKIIEIADEFQLMHVNRVGLFSQSQVGDTIRVYARRKVTDNWTKIDIDKEGNPKNFGEVPNSEDNFAEVPVPPPAPDLPVAKPAPAPAATERDIRNAPVQITDAIKASVSTNITTALKSFSPSNVTFDAINKTWSCSFKQVKTDVLCTFRYDAKVGPRLQLFRFSADNKSIEWNPSMDELKDLTTNIETIVLYQKLVDKKLSVSLNPVSIQINLPNSEIIMVRGTGKGKICLSHHSLYDHNKHNNVLYREFKNFDSLITYVKVGAPIDTINDYVEASEGSRPTPPPAPALVPKPAETTVIPPPTTASKPSTKVSVADDEPAVAEIATTPRKKTEEDIPAEIEQELKVKKDTFATKALDLRRKSVDALYDAYGSEELNDLSYVALKREMDHLRTVDTVGFDKSDDEYINTQERIAELTPILQRVKKAVEKLNSEYAEKIGKSKEAEARIQVFTDRSNEMKIKYDQMKDLRADPTVIITEAEIEKTRKDYLSALASEEKAIDADFGNLEDIANATNSARSKARERTQQIYRERAAVQTKEERAVSYEQSVKISFGHFNKIVQFFNERKLPTMNSAEILDKMKALQTRIADLRETLGAARRAGVDSHKLEKYSQMLHVLNTLHDKGWARYRELEAADRQSTAYTFSEKLKFPNYNVMCDINDDEAKISINHKDHDNSLVLSVDKNSLDVKEVIVYKATEKNARGIRFDNKTITYAEPRPILNENSLNRIMDALSKGGMKMNLDETEKLIKETIKPL